MEEDSTVDHEVDSQEPTRHRRGSPNQIYRLSEQGSPNRNQPIQADKNTEVLMNINENMEQMASLLSTLCRRLPQLPDGCPPDKNRQSSRTHATSETQQSVESDSNPSSSPDEDDRSYKRRKRTIRGKDQLSIHASEDESVDVKLLTGHQSQQVTDQQQVDNSILKELSDLLDEGETTSPAIQKQLAEIADKPWSTRLTSDKIKKLTERYNRPENVSNIIPTKVNNEIWSQLSSSKKKMDLQLANLQQTICKVAITVLQTGDELLPKTNGETSKNLASRSVDALAMLGHANAEISRLRREQIRFALRPEYSYICKADIPNGPLLFGEDLPTQLVYVLPIPQRNDVQYISQNHTTWINVLVIMGYQINIRVRRRIFEEARIIPPNERNPQCATRGNDQTFGRNKGKCKFISYIYANFSGIFKVTMCIFSRGSGLPLLA